MRRPAWSLALAALLVGGSFLLLEAAWAAPPVSALLETLRLARPNARLEAPAFDLATPGSRSVRLGDLRGRVVLLYFWATW